jgi:hypothetical protein
MGQGKEPQHRSKRECPEFFDYRSWKFELRLQGSDGR